MRDEQRTDVGSVSCSAERFEWSIPDFLSRFGKDAEQQQQHTVYVWSPAFPSSSGRQWELGLRRKDRNERIVLLLNLLEEDSREGESPAVGVSFTPGLRTSSGGEILEGDTVTTTFERLRRSFGGSALPPEVTFGDLERSRSEFLTPSGALILTCRIGIGDGSGLSRDGQPPTQAPDHTKLVEDFKDLLLNQIDTDIVLKVADKEFKAHRLIIRTRSRVFSAMFAHDTEERRTGVVHIEDCDPDTFPDFLHYVYTGRVEALTTEKALHLYRTADKYELLELKEQCVELMKRGLTVDNVCDILELSLLHNEMTLTEVATRFFVDNPVEISLTQRWQKFLKENPTAANVLIIRGFRKNRRRSYPSD